MLAVREFKLQCVAVLLLAFSHPHPSPFFLSFFYFAEVLYESKCHLVRTHTHLSLLFFVFVPPTHPNTTNTTLGITGFVRRRQRSVLLIQPLCPHQTLPPEGRRALRLRLFFILLCHCFPLISPIMRNSFSLSHSLPFLYLPSVRFVLLLSESTTPHL